MILVIPFPSKGEIDGLQESVIVKKSPISPSISPQTSQCVLHNTEVESSIELESKSIQFDSSIWHEIFIVPSNWLCIPSFSLYSYLVFLQGTPGSIPWGVYTTYLPTILCTEKHISIDTV